MSFMQGIIDANDDVAAGAPMARENVAYLRQLEVNMEPEKLPDSAFALNLITKTGSVIRKYPIQTPHDTALSVWYFTKVAEERLPEEIRKVAATFLKAACEAHGVSPTGMIHQWADAAIKDNSIVLANASTNVPVPRVKLAHDDYALITDSGQKKYPINTPNLVKTAAKYFRENWKQITPAWRHQMADNITKKAGALGVEVPVEDAEILEKYASGRYSNILHVAINERKNALQHDDVAVQTLDALFEKRASMEPAKFAQSLETFDQMYGLNEYWDSTIIDPYQSTFGGIKVEKPIYVLGRPVYRDKIAALATDEKVLKHHFNADFVEQFRAAPIEVFQKLATPDQELMLVLIDEKENASR